MRGTSWITKRGFELQKKSRLIKYNLRIGNNIYFFSVPLLQYYFISFKISSCSYNKITIIQIQISRQNWNGFFKNISHQMMLYLTTIVSRAKKKWFKAKKVKKLALNSQLLAVQILTNDVQVLILCLSYFITIYCKKKPLLNCSTKTWRV